MMAQFAARGFGNWAKRNPVLAASLTLSSKYGAADALTQHVSISNQDDKDSKDQQLDLKRSFLFWSFGFVYGAINYRVFKLFTVFNLSPIKMAMADTLVHVPCVLMPVFYACKSFIVEEEISAENTRAGLTNWRDNLVEDYKMCVAVWGPIDLVMFSYVPLHLVSACFAPCFGLRAVSGVLSIQFPYFTLPPLPLPCQRTPFLSVVGFIFPCLLSMRRGSTGSEPEGASANSSPVKDAPPPAAAAAAGA